ncbi:MULTISPECIES: hypothetical protein [unclassified Streptomyces]|nr:MULTISPECIES: hypothetical protein [unclassified Streptomyces]PBC72229.1 hypothetical protein BX261_7311 [Streptomyces sp. 2321.6]SDR62045.1 hypothetical protein SAMN05216511_7258 [Streptomyces sp. KS_16]SEE49818.1 hypothetical protein SAMN05428940_7307 [Streptomyces sp. 2133.1]SNC77864.1 hypothetical protein SAMN06272741_7281 [Streptomyces sp. 2114.4]
MKVYTLVMQIETEDDDQLSAKDVKAMVYDAGSDLPFGFEITKVEEAN